MKIISSLTLTDICDIAIVSILIYYLIVFIRETKAVQLLKGILVLFLITFLAHSLRLATLNWLLEKIFAIGIVALVVIFQPELRNVLRKLGTGRILPFSPLHPPQATEILEAVRALAEHRIGSIIILERATRLGTYIETGCSLDSIIDRRILLTIFNPASPLHDGAVIIQDNRLAAAGCILPLDSRPKQEFWGTRHLSALKLSEETDALAIVTSEETGRISLAADGRIYENLSLSELRLKIEQAFNRQRQSNE
ncbi:MAG: diadenylate cyclase CdaA [Candidatus Omnitrophica bacterium]|nr:diadenylate cyclase CdaA [Candidatus Omnitrophota bacterium]